MGKYGFGKDGRFSLSGCCHSFCCSPGRNDISKAKPLYCSSSYIQVHHGGVASGKVTEDRPEALKPVCLFPMRQMGCAR